MLHLVCVEEVGGLNGVPRGHGREHRVDFVEILLAVDGAEAVPASARTIEPVLDAVRLEHLLGAGNRWLGNLFAVLLREA